MPGLIERIRVWFRDYKSPDGKPQNRFAFDDKPLNKEFTMQVWALHVDHMSVSISGPAWAANLTPVTPAHPCAGDRGNAWLLQCSES